MAVQADMQIVLPVLRLKVLKESMRKLSHKHHELVQPQPVDAKPFPPHCVQEHREVQESSLQIKQAN